jgi:hypothetical protein
VSESLSYTCPEWLVGIKTGGEEVSVTCALGMNRDRLARAYSPSLLERCFHLVLTFRRSGPLL